jgi:hypothetical protein
MLLIIAIVGTTVAPSCTRPQSRLGLRRINSADIPDTSKVAITGASGHRKSQ